MNHSTFKTEKPYVLPRIHPAIRRALEQKELIFSLMDGLGSPLNLMFPQNMEDNVKSFQDVYKKYHLKGRIYYTSKPCKSSALLRHATLLPIGLDVSSPKSLKEALGSGFSPDRIEATGPKNPDYILNALQVGVLLNVDNFEELRLIAALCKKIQLKNKARVFIRLSGFTANHPNFTPQDDTFGINGNDASMIIEWLLQHKEIIQFEGFSFHLSSREGVMQRIVAIENLLKYTFDAIKKGLKPKGINIGGSYFIQYADDELEWQNYVRDLKRSVLGELPNQTWNNTGLGYKEENGVLGGGPMFSNHFSPNAKGDQLDTILGTRLKQFGNATIGSIIRDSLLELYIEPGRAMLDQCGITLAKVNFSKKSSWGDDLVFADVNQTNLNSLNHKNLTQSVVLYRDEKKRLTNDNGIFYVGNLCVSYDILQYNKQYPQYIPAAGDIICFMNTAPYAMDFHESETLMQPMAKKAALWEDNSVWRWALDEKYSPIDYTTLEI